MTERKKGKKTRGKTRRSSDPAEVEVRSAKLERKDTKRGIVRGNDVCLVGSRGKLRLGKATFAGLKLEREIEKIEIDAPRHIGFLSFFLFMYIPFLDYYTSRIVS